MRSIDFHYDFRSPYTYLALSQLPSLGAQIRFHPFDIVKVMERVGNVPTSITCRAKGRYLQHDLARWAKRYGVTYAPNPAMRKMDVNRLFRAAIAADKAGQAQPAVTALFAALWQDPKPVETGDDILAILAGAGIDPARLGDIDDPSLQASLDAATDAAAERGLFGSPIFFVGDEMFFGNDRLDFVAEALERQA